MALHSGPVVTVFAIVGLLVLSAFFSSSETVLFTLSGQWLSEQTASNDPRLAALRGLRDDPHRLLVTLLVGNNVVNVAIASATTALVLEYVPPGRAVWVATVGASFIVLVCGEIVPKAYGLGNATSWAIRVARPLALVERVLYPAVVVFDVLTRGVNARIGGEPRIETSYLEE